jgi:hypothetical protein
MDQIIGCLASHSGPLQRIPVQNIHGYNLEMRMASIGTTGQFGGRTGPGPDMISLVQEHGDETPSHIAGRPENEYGFLGRMHMVACLLIIHG